LIAKWADNENRDGEGIHTWASTSASSLLAKKPTEKRHMLSRNGNRSCSILRRSALQIIYFPVAYSSIIRQIMYDTSKKRMTVAERRVTGCHELRYETWPDLRDEPNLFSIT
jgi:hypothetical protein